MSRPDRWTDDEVALFAKLRLDGCPMLEISARMGRSMSSLARKLKTLNVPARTGHFEPVERPKRIKRAGKRTLAAAQ